MYPVSMTYTSTTSKVTHAIIRQDDRYIILYKHSDGIIYMYKDTFALTDRPTQLRWILDRNVKSRRGWDRNKYTIWHQCSVATTNPC